MGELRLDLTQLVPPAVEAMEEISLLNGTLASEQFSLSGLCGCLVGVCASTLISLLWELIAMMLGSCITNSPVHRNVTQAGFTAP